MFPDIEFGGDNAGKAELDSYGMPQPTFHFKYSSKDRERNQRMMTDMCEVASHLGGYIPGSNPQFMAPGLALHIMVCLSPSRRLLNLNQHYVVSQGTIRAGTDKNTSVVDKNSKVHDIPNLWLGGNGVIPSAMACNPTLTSVRLSSCSIITSAPLINVSCPFIGLLRSASFRLHCQVFGGSPPVEYLGRALETFRAS